MKHQPLRLYRYLFLYFFVTSCCATPIEIQEEKDSFMTPIQTNTFETLSLAPTPPPQCLDNTTTQTRYTSLICWLWELQLEIPDQHVRKGIISVSIEDMICSQFQVNTTDSSYIHGSTTIDPKLDVSIYGVSTVCNGRYKSGLTGGDVTVIVQTIQNEPIHIQTSLKAIIHYENDVDVVKFPKQAKMETCESNLEVPKKGGISFSGSISAKFVDLFSRPIASHVTSALNEQICPQLTDAIDTQLNPLIQKMDDALTKFIFGTNHVMTSETTLDRTGTKIGTEQLESIMSSVKRELGIENSFTHFDNSIVEPNTVDSNDMSRTEIGLNNNSTNETEILQWKEISTLESIIQKASSFINSHLDKGIFLDILDKIGWFGDSNDSTCTDCGYFFRGVNGLIRNITDGGSIGFGVHREWCFDIDNVGNATLRLENMTIRGVDHWKHFAIGTQEPHFVYPNIALDDIEVDASIDLKIFPGEDTFIRGTPLEESFDVYVNLGELKLSTGIGAQLMKEELQKIFVEDLLDGNFGVLIKTLNELKLFGAKSIVNVGSAKFEASNSSDSLEVSIDEILNNVLSLLLHEYEDLVSRIIESAIRGPVVDVVNKAIEDWIQSVFDLTLPSTIQKDEMGYFSFNESDVVHTVHDFLASDYFSSAANSYISCISNFISQNEISPSPLMRNGLVVLIQKVLFNGFNLNTIDVLDAVDASHIDFGMLTNSRNNISLDFVTSVDYPFEELSVTFSMQSMLASLSGSTGLKMLYNMTALNETDLLTMLTNPFQPFNEISQPSGFYNTSIFLEKVNTLINVNVSEHGKNRMVTFESNDDDHFGDKLSKVIGTAATLIEHLTNGMLQIGFDQTSSLSKPEEASKRTEKQPNWAIALPSIFLFFNSLFWITFNHQTRTQTLSKKSYGRSFTTPESLIYHKKVPHAFRSLIPLALVATIFIFMVSNFSIGASVDLQLTSENGFILKIPTITTFSLGKTVKEMYQASVYTLMLLVLVFSGIWPYVKLLMMMVAWTCPVTIISFDRREQILVWLDALGKYSLVDSFVLVLMLVSFKFHIEFPGLVTVDSFVIPAFGFYLFLTATVLSLVIGHAVTFLHRWSKLPDIPSSSSKESISSHCYSIARTSGTRQSARLSKKGSMVWGLIAIICIVTLGVGSINKSFTFAFEGLIGIVMGDNRRNSYSLLSLGTSLPLSVEDPKNFGIWCIQWTFFFFALMMPFICILTISILFYVPMSLKRQQTVFMIAEITNAWSAVEVFLLSIMASMLELSQFAAFMVGDHCNFLQAQFFQDLFHGENTCFSVRSIVNPGVTYLCIGVALYNFIVFTGLNLAHVALEERMFQELGGRIFLEGTPDKEVPHESRIMAKLATKGIFKSLVQKITYD